jgi:hypothetical protein
MYTYIYTYIHTYIYIYYQVQRLRTYAGVYPDYLFSVGESPAAGGEKGKHQCAHERAPCKTLFSGSTANGSYVLTLFVGRVTHTHTHDTGYCCDASI